MLTPDPHRQEKERWETALLGPRVQWPVNQATAIPQEIVLGMVSTTALEGVLTASGFAVNEQLLEDFTRIALGKLDLSELEVSANSLWDSPTVDIQQLEALTVSPLKVVQDLRYVILTQSLMSESSESWRAKPESDIRPEIIIQVTSGGVAGTPKLIISLGEIPMQISDQGIRERWNFITAFFQELQSALPQPLDEYVYQQDFQSASVQVGACTLKMQRRDLDPSQYLSIVEPSRSEPGADLELALVSPRDLMNVLAGLKVGLPLNIIEYLYAASLNDKQALTPQAFTAVYGHNIEIQFSRVRSCGIDDGEIELSAVHCLALETCYGGAVLTLRTEPPSDFNPHGSWLRCTLSFDGRTLHFPDRDWKQLLSRCAKIILEGDAPEAEEE